MKKYTVRLKVYALVETTIQATDLEAALIEANQKFHGEDPFDEGIIKLGKKFYRTYMDESVAITGVSEV